MQSSLLLDSSFLKLIYILLTTFIIWVVLQLLTKTFVNAISEGSARAKRVRTLTSVVRTVSSTILVIIALLQILDVLGLNVTPLLASAGVVGLAIGFGAQTLVKDVISGFFLLAENQFDDGDEVEINGKRGVVEKITLRTLWVREKNGAIHIIPNGTITLVSNYSRMKDGLKGVSK